MGIEDFTLKEELGKGSFGKVIKVVRKSDGSIYAMKQIKLQRLKDKDKKNALNEIRFLASIQHPNIVGYREAFYDEKSENLCVVMDYANEGDLSGKIKKHINAKVRIKEDVIWKVAYQLLEGLGKLHDSNIIHRDIKPANVFFNNGKAQLGDLNVAKHLKDPFTVTQTGTPYYASPEVWSEEPYDYKSDIWSLGCVIYQIAMLKPPFRAENAEQLFKKILTGKYDKISGYYSESLSKFIEQMLNLNQKKRPDAKQLLCQQRMLAFKNEQNLEDDEKQLMGTIQFPKNLKFLNENLPGAKYEEEGEDSGPKFRTLKIIEGNPKKQISKKLIPIPSLQNIRSEKNIPRQQVKITLAKKAKVLNKNGSQKLIF